MLEKCLILSLTINDIFLLRRTNSIFFFSKKFDYIFNNLGLQLLEIRNYLPSRCPEENSPDAKLYKCPSRSRVTRRQSPNGSVLSKGLIYLIGLDLATSAYILDNSSIIIPFSYTLHYTQEARVSSSFYDTDLFIDNKKKNAKDGKT